eukprot:3895817-Amphidinium_carterae.3
MDGSVIVAPIIVSVVEVRLKDRDVTRFNSLTVSIAQSPGGKMGVFNHVMLTLKPDMLQLSKRG